MKKIITYVLLLICSLSFAQTKKIEFTKEFSYTFNDKNKEKLQKINLKMLASKNQEFLSFFDINMMPFHFFTSKLGTNMVNIGLDNQLKNSMYSNYMYGFARESIKKEAKVINLNTQENILGTKCNNYLISISDQTYGTDEKIKLCVDNSSSAFNNISVLKGMLHQLGATQLNNLDIKGLIMKAGPEEKYDQEYFVLTSTKDANYHVFFDQSKAMTDSQRTQDSLMLAYKEMEEKYAVADSIAYETDAVAAAADSAIAVADYDYYEEPAIPYESTYKEKIDYKKIDLAILNEYNKRHMVSIPKFCTKLNEIPEFDNEDLKKHIYNYLGQTCDLYLADNRDHSVAVKITVDQVRQEGLYLMEIRDKLSKKDKEKLDKYLNNLD